MNRRRLSSSSTAGLFSMPATRPALTLRQSHSETASKPFAVHHDDSKEYDDVVAPFSFDRITALSSLQSKKISAPISVAHDEEEPSHREDDEDDDDDDGASTESTSRSEDSYSASEGHTHSLSPSLASDSDVVADPIVHEMERVSTSNRHHRSKTAGTDPSAAPSTASDGERSLNPSSKESEAASTAPTVDAYRLLEQRLIERIQNGQCPRHHRLRDDILSLPTPSAAAAQSLPLRHRCSEHNLSLSAYPPPSRRRHGRRQLSLPPVQMLEPLERGQSAMESSPSSSSPMTPGPLLVAHSQSLRSVQPTNIVTAFSPSPLSAAYSTPPALRKGGAGGHRLMTPSNLTLFAFNHSDRTMTRLDPLEIAGHPSCSSRSPSMVTPCYSSPGGSRPSCDSMHSLRSLPRSSPTESTPFGGFDAVGAYDSMDDESPVYLQGGPRGKYTDIARHEGALYKFEDFASTHFEGAARRETQSTLNLFRGIGRSKTKGRRRRDIASLTTFGTFKSLKRPLLKMASRKMERLSMSIWKHFCCAIGLQKSSKSEAAHIARILAVALRPETEQAVRDEIYCQIIKETNYRDPSHRDNAQRAWRVMAVCCSTFRPSPHFARYLASFLFRRALDVTFSTATTREYAMFSLHALDETMANGPRKWPPSEAEIRSVVDRMPIAVAIHFLDDDDRLSLSVTSQTNVAQIREALAAKLQLRFPESFGLFETEQIPPTKTQRKAAAHLLPAERALADSERVMDVVTEWGRCPAANARSFRLVFKCKAFGRRRLDRYSRSGLKMVYQHSVCSVVHSQWPIHCEDQDLFYLAAIQFVAKYGNDSALNVHRLREAMEQYLPRRVLRKYSVRQCEQLVLQNVDTLHCGLAPQQLWRHYVRFVDARTINASF